MFILYNHLLTYNVTSSTSQLLTVNWLMSTYKHWVGKREWNHPFEIMISGKLFRQILDKFLVSPVVQNARVQVCLPDGSFFDIKEIKLLENKLIGVRESHRLVITIEPETYRMGKVLKKV